MLIIAERIHSSRRYIASAISSANKRFIQNEAKAQEQAGADYIEVNAAVFPGEEAERLRWVVEAVQEVTDLPLSIGSPNPEAICAVMDLLKRRPLINGVNLEPMRLMRILPLVVEHKTKVIGCCQAQHLLPQTIEEKVQIAGELVKAVEKAGIPLEDLYIDPLPHPLASHPRSAVNTIEAIDRIMTAFPGVHTTCRLNRVSHGLPKKGLVNLTFLVTAIYRGLDAVILDPTDRQLYGAVKAAQLVAGKDDSSLEYVAAFREGRFE